MTANNTALSLSPRFKPLSATPEFYGEASANRIRKRQTVRIPHTFQRYPCTTRESKRSNPRQFLVQAGPYRTVLTRNQTGFPDWGRRTRATVSAPFSELPHARNCCFSAFPGLIKERSYRRSQFGDPLVPTLVVVIIPVNRPGDFPRPGVFAVVPTVVGGFSVVNP